MPVKRKNHGRMKNHAGHNANKPCQNCYKLVPQDKIISRFGVKQLIESNIQQDVLQASITEGIELPKLYHKTQYCVNCAIHLHLVRVRSNEDRKVRRVVNRFPRLDKKRADAKRDAKKVAPVAAPETAAPVAAQ